MKKPKDKTNYYFVDESGDPIFYGKYGKLILNKEGVSKILIIGFIKTEMPNLIRKKLKTLRNEIKNDPYLKGIPSLKSSLIFFHAKDDCSEVREKVFKAILDLQFTAEIYIARKIEGVFKKRHNKDENTFYDDLVSKLFENKLHLTTNNKIYFAVRGTKKRQVPLQSAIQRAITKFEQKSNSKITSNIKIQAQTPSGEPCLQVIDYINWAVQRIFIKKEERFYNFVKDKIKFLVDIYDFDKYPNNYYSKRNNFDIKKISPL